MSTGNEPAGLINSQRRETPKVSPALEAKNGSEIAAIQRHMQEIVAASGTSEPPPAELMRIFRSLEFSAPVNDLQKERAVDSLQRGFGNQYVQRMLASSGSRQTRPPAGSPSHGDSIQTKLEVSTPGDALEREADAMANQVMSMPAQTQSLSHASGSSINRQAGLAAGGPIRRAAAAAAPAPAVSTDFEKNLNARRGSGQPLSQSSRDFFEPRFGQDLSAVRVHHDGESAAAAQEIGAQAFTHGRDIYFNQGKYQPETSGGRHLMAHELAHTVQQTGGGPARQIQRQLIQRAGPPPTGPTGTSGSTGTTGAAASLPPLSVADYPVAPFKLSHPSYKGKQYVRAKEYARSGPHDDPRQVFQWEQGVESVAAAGKLTSGFNLNQANRVYMIRARPKFGKAFQAIGNADTIAKGLKRPFWRPSGAFQEYDVDHVVDLVFSGWPRNSGQWANAIENMQLLDKKSNAGLGGNFEKNLEPLVRTALSDPTADARKVVKSRDITFSSFKASVDPSNLHVWTKDKIDKGEHIDVLTSMPKASRPDIEVLDLADTNPLDSSPFSSHKLGPDWLGSSTKFVIFTKAGGGYKRELLWTDPANTTTSEAQKKKLRVPGYHIDSITFNRNRTNLSDSVGTLTGHVFKVAKATGLVDTTATSAPPWQIKPVPGTQFAGFLDFDQLRDQIVAIQITPFSPVKFDVMGLDDEKGIVAWGRVLPTIPLISAAQLNLVIEGDDLRVEKAFNAGDFSLPKPFQVNDCTLTVSLGLQSGLKIAGRLDFGIERVGEGFLQASASTGQGFALEGGFDFDSKTFKPARVRLRYENHRFSGEGELGIPSGKVRGIKAAHLTAAYADDRLTAHGDVEFTIPGLEQGTLDLTYSEAEGMTLAGSLQLGAMPGIRGGTLAAQLRKPAGAPDWQISAKGTAMPAIPGVDASLTVAYDNGIFTAEARAAYSRGMLSGTILAGATNRPISPEGQPLEATEPAAKITPYGQGQLTIKIAPWLQGTIGVRILPNGEIEVTGSIGLPSSLNIFAEKALKKNIFSIGIDIPIVGIAFAGQRIGIFATIKGGLDVDAGIGPGQLRELGLTITYNPAHEDQTHVTGRAQLYIPAHAGLRLFVSGGLGVGIPIVSATAELEVGAALGLEGAVTAAVEVDWLANRGLIINALGEIYAQPKFKFDVVGKVLVEADLWLTTIELYSHKWKLKEFEYGSDLRFGVKFPIHYEEGKPFDVSLSDVQFEVPHIDPMDLLTGLIKRI